MLTRALSVIVVVLLLVGLSRAADETQVKGVIKSVDVEKKVVKVTTADKKLVEVVFTNDGPALFGPSNGKVPKALKDDRFVEGWDVTLTFEKKDGKDVITKFQLGKKK